MTMKFASIFLSHASKQASFMDELAEELSRRGVLPWLDRHELKAGANLVSRLRQAVQSQERVAVLLTPDAADSRWVESELVTALQQIPDAIERVIPICYGNPYALIKPHRVLKDKWLHPNGRDVTVVYIDLETRPPASSPAAFAAQRLAASIFESVGTRRCHDLVIMLDQRAHGAGRRIGRPTLPENVGRLEDAPVLVFRPDLGVRSNSDMIQDWEDVADTCIAALTEAIGPRVAGPKNIYLYGDAQLSWPFLLGLRYFDRLCGRRLYCHNPEGDQVFEFNFQRGALPQGRPHLGSWVGTGNAPQHADEIALFVGKRRFIRTIQAYLAGMQLPPTLLHFEHTAGMDQAAVVQLIADAVAALELYQQEWNLQRVRLFCDLPFAAMPLLGANLINVVNGGVSFMEYRKDLQGKTPPPDPTRWYVELKMGAQI